MQRMQRSRTVLVVEEQAAEVQDIPGPRALLAGTLHLPSITTGWVLGGWRMEERREGAAVAD